VPGQGTGIKIIAAARIAADQEDDLLAGVKIIRSGRGQKAACGGGKGRSAKRQCAKPLAAVMDVHWTFSHFPRGAVRHTLWTGHFIPEMASQRNRDDKMRRPRSTREVRRGRAVGRPEWAGICETGFPET